MTAEQFASHRTILNGMLLDHVGPDASIVEVHDHFVDECMYRARVLLTDPEPILAYAVCVKSSHPKSVNGITWWWEDELDG